LTHCIKIKQFSIIVGYSGSYTVSCGDPIFIFYIPVSYRYAIIFTLQNLFYDHWVIFSVQVNKVDTEPLTTYLTSLKNFYVVSKKRTFKVYFLLKLTDILKLFPTISITLFEFVIYWFFKGGLPLTLDRPVILVHGTQYHELFRSIMPNYSYSKYSCRFSCSTFESYYCVKWQLSYTRPISRNISIHLIGFMPSVPIVN